GASVSYTFPAGGRRPGLAMTWHDGGKKPPAELFGGEQVTAAGCLIVGDKGKLYSQNDYGGTYKLLGQVEEPKVDVTPSPGHFEEFVRSVRGNGKTISNILAYARPLTEPAVLGNLPLRA